MDPARSVAPSRIVRASVPLRPDDLGAAVDSLAASFRGTEMASVVIFAAQRGSLELLGPMLADRIDAPVFGCTTAGEIGPDGYAESSISAVGFPADLFRVRPFYIPDARNCDEETIRNLSRAASSIRGLKQRGFALLLVDGMSLSEERVAAQCDAALGGLPLFGGSAGDDDHFGSTWILYDGRFRTGGALVLLVETELPFHVFKLQHQRSIENELVITSACPEERLVREIDGMPAADAYAASLGLEARDLDATICTQHPLAIRIGGVDYIRSIQKVHPDGSMLFYCAIDDGLVLSVTRPGDFVERLRTDLGGAVSSVPSPQLLIACECIQRRRIALELGVEGQVNAILGKYPVVGFHTYGEQFNGLHLNQTLTGIVVGR